MTELEKNMAATDLRGVTDCHIHVIDPAFPMVPVRSYTPRPVLASDVRAMMARCGVDRVVIVQISVYGNDNSAMLAAMEDLGDCARGVIHLTGTETADDIARLHGKGARGVRINLFSTSQTDPDAARARLDAAARLCAPAGWHIQLFAVPEVLTALADGLPDLPVPVVLDHFALLSASRRGGEAEATVLRLLESGNVWIKLSARYRLEGREEPGRVAALARDLAEAAPDRVLWASDWPHPPEHAGLPAENPPERPYRDIDTPGLLRETEDWFPDMADRRKLLVTNPAKLYGF